MKNRSAGKGEIPNEERDEKRTIKHRESTAGESIVKTEFPESKTVLPETKSPAQPNASQI
jgi:hypothetical protein